MPGCFSPASYLRASLVLSHCGSSKSSCSKAARPNHICPGSGFRRRDISAAAIGAERDARRMRNVRENFQSSGSGRRGIVQFDHGIRAVVRNVKIAGTIERETHRLDEL